MRSSPASRCSPGARTRGIAFVLGVAALVGGCNRPTIKEAAKSSQNLILLQHAYSKAIQELKRPPDNAKELAPFLVEPGAIDEILRSPDDGEPYVVHWGVDPRAGEAVVLAYEKNGKNGRRFVLWGHVVQRLNDEEFKTTRFPARYPPPF